MQTPIDYANLFLDMNAFFASVEQQVQPNLRGQPICVAPYTGNTGCCIAKSYEAKAYGVGITSVGEARKLCPTIKIIESRPKLYIFYHKQILKVLESFSPFVEVKSVDEFNIKLTGSDRKIVNATMMAKNLKEAITSQVGDYLKCSIGISSSPWLAKLAGESKKPDGLVALKLEELPDFYKNLELTDLPGINTKMEYQFHQKGIKNLPEFYSQPLSHLSLWFGHPGRIWYYRLRGFEIDTATTEVKSIGHSHVLAPKYRNKFAARRVLVKLTEKCAVRLRAQNLWSSGVSLSISFLSGGGVRKNKTTDLVQDSQSIQRAVLSLYDSLKIQSPPLRIAVTLFNLKKVQNEQISLFSDIEKSKKISRTLDKINDKFGDDTIYPASMFGTSDAAPNRIPFGPPR